MSQKLKPGSVELEAAFGEWIKRHAYNPDEAIAHFMEKSEFVRNAVDTVVEHARKKITDNARKHLQRLSEDPVFTAQFPMVYKLPESGRQGHALHGIADHRRARRRMGGPGLGGRRLSGRSARQRRRAKANYIELARMHIESHISCPGDFKPRLRK